MHAQVSPNDVRAAFADQAGWCRKLGSPFTGLICEILGERLDQSTPIGAKVLNWKGDPGSSSGDALPLRLAGALNGLVQSGQAPALAALYPPNPTPETNRLWQELTRTMQAHEAAILARLDLAPQTNEVGRSASLMTGLLILADELDLPFELFELGCSAGLNLNLGRFDYDLGGVRAGDPASPVHITPQWEGPPPPKAEVEVLSARGVDLSPLDLTNPDQRELLTAYVWADQLDRLERIRAAIDLALEFPPGPETGDAADWLEKTLTGVKAGVCRVVYHTIAFQYFPPAVKARIAEHLAKIGSAASPEAPLAWLRLESDPEYGNAYSLRLTLWPEGHERVIGLGHPHGLKFKRF